MLTIYKSGYGCIDMPTADTAPKGSWINLINPTPAELERVALSTLVPIDILTAALDEEERSRIEIEDEYLLIIIDIPKQHSRDIYDTLPLSIIITAEQTITICLEENAVISEFLIKERCFNTVKKTRFLFQILYQSAILFLKYLRQINKRTDEIEMSLRKSMENREIFQLLDLQKALTYFSTSLRSNHIVLEKLLRLRTNPHLQHLIKLYEEDEDLLEDVIIEYKQAMEMVQMYTHILNGMIEVFSSIINNNLNRVMRLLASITIIIAVPTMISSFFGMNVPIPWTEESNGFLYVILCAAAITGLSTYTLWKKKFI